MGAAAKPGAHWCLRHVIPLTDRDDPAAFRTMATCGPFGQAMRAVAQNPDRSCVYLGPDGCALHDRAPTLCRAAMADGPIPNPFTPEMRP